MISQMASPLYIAGDIQEFLEVERPSDPRICGILEELAVNLEELHRVIAVLSKYSTGKAVDRDVLRAYNVYKSAISGSVD